MVGWFPVLTLQAPLTQSEVPALAPPEDLLLLLLRAHSHRNPRDPLGTLATFPFVTLCLSGSSASLSVRLLLLAPSQSRLLWLSRCASEGHRLDGLFVWVSFSFFVLFVGLVTRCMLGCLYLCLCWLVYLSVCPLSPVSVCRFLYLPFSVNLFFLTSL